MVLAITGEINSWEYDLRCHELGQPVMSSEDKTMGPGRTRKFSLAPDT